ncbi:MAG: hypothetical protein EOM40_08040 [Clostridia bacterium]|nr:hypothetical protein [Clostridia bacterium]
MRKKGMLTGLLCLILTVMAVFPVSAAEQDSRKSDVTLEVEVPPHAPVNDGKAEVTLDDDTVITVEGKELPENIQLIIEVITKEDAAWKLIEDAMNGRGTNIKPYDIYFVDNEGKRVELDTKMTISIRLEKGYKNPIVCYVAENGAVTKKETKVNKNEIAFDMNHNSYYVIAEAVDAGTTEPTTKPTTKPTSSPGTDTTKTDATSVNTGDETSLTLWISILELSVLCVGGLLLLRYKKPEKE